AGARIYDLVNPIGKTVHHGRADADAAWAAREACEYLVMMMAPMMPHLAEECWTELGQSGLVAEARWPVLDEALLVEDSIVLPVQVNGKKKGEITVARDASTADVEAATVAQDFVQRALEGRAPRKIIVVPQRIVNVVG
ncbi:MAG: class I tRNA ligase family protein, partial [Pannonibacter sp.]